MIHITKIGTQNISLTENLWGTPANLYLLETYLSNEIKIIRTVRDIVEIIASFIKLNPHTLHQLLQTQRERQLRFLDSYKEEVELLCEAVMDPSGQVEKNLFSLLNLLKEENRKYLHIVEYNDLVDDTDNTVKRSMTS